MKLTAYSDYICTCCNLHLKSFVLDWKWKRVNHILKNNRLAGLHAREENSVESIKNRIWGARHPILTNITPMKFSMKISKEKILQKNKHHSCGSQERCKYGNEIALSLHLHIYIFFLNFFFLNKIVMVFGKILAGPGQASDNSSNNYQKWSGIVAL